MGVCVDEGEEEDVRFMLANFSSCFLRWSSSFTIPLASPSGVRISAPVPERFLIGAGAGGGGRAGRAKGVEHRGTW